MDEYIFEPRLDFTPLQLSGLLDGFDGALERFAVHPSYVQRLAEDGRGFDTRHAPERAGGVVGILAGRFVGNQTGAVRHLLGRPDPPFRYRQSVKLRLPLSPRR